jgi:small GTP-binding protein
MSSKRPVLLKLILVGESGVGKTSVLWTLCEKKLRGDESMTPTIGVDFLSHQVSLDGSRTATLQIWDTSGQERFRSITSPFFRGADGVLFVFDVTSRASFDALDGWISTTQQYFSDGVIPAAILVGNKVDSAPDERAVSAADAQRLAAKHQLAAYVETTATGRDSVVKAFEALTAAIRIKPNNPVEPTPVMMLAAFNGRRSVLDDQQQRQSSYCCSK